MNKMCRAATCVLLSLALALPGCVRAQIRAPLPQPAEEAAIEALITSYLHARDSGETSVEIEAYRVAIMAAVEIWRVYSLCVVDREELAGISTVEIEELQARRDRAVAQRDAALVNRWRWGAVGMAIGVVVGVVVVCLAR